MSYETIAINPHPDWSKPRTNGDRFRSMTDEEFAGWIDEHFMKAVWCNSPPDDCPPHGNCRTCVMDWLKQEVDA